MFLEELDKFTGKVVGCSRPIKGWVFLNEGPVMLTELFGSQSSVLFAELRPRVGSYVCYIRSRGGYVYIGAGYRHRM